MSMTGAEVVVVVVVVVLGVIALSSYEGSGLLPIVVRAARRCRRWWEMKADARLMTMIPGLMVENDATAAALVVGGRDGLTRGLGCCGGGGSYRFRRGISTTGASALYLLITVRLRTIWCVILSLSNFG
jgi:hypothetical protein